MHVQRNNRFPVRNTGSQYTQVLGRERKDVVRGTNHEQNNKGHILKEA